MNGAGFGGWFAVRQALRIGSQPPFVLPLSANGWGHLGNVSLKSYGSHMSDRVIAKRIDPFEASLRFLLVIVFPKSSSKNFPLALNIAEGAEQFGVAEINRKPIYFVCFGNSQADAGRAIALLDYVRTWKGVQIFSRGRLLQSSYSVEQVLNSFLEAQSCRDPTAHCHSVIDDPFSEEIEEKGLSLSIQVVERPPIKYEIEIKRFSFPCKFLLHRFRFQKEHPATAQDQIQAAAVSQGCDWCPNFNPDNWKQVGVRKIVKEYFL